MGFSAAVESPSPTSVTMPVTVRVRSGASTRCPGWTCPSRAGGIEYVSVSNPRVAPTIRILACILPLFAHRSERPRACNLHPVRAMRRAAVAPVLRPPHGLVLSQARAVWLNLVMEARPHEAVLGGETKRMLRFLTAGESHGPELV